MSIILYILLGIATIVAALAIWIKVSIWIMGLGIDDDGQIDWPWRKE